MASTIHQVAGLLAATRQWLLFLVALAAAEPRAPHGHG
jgi:hypothetical protein